MARLLDEYPLVFEEYYALLFGQQGESFRQRRERTRMERVNRIFGRRK